MSDLPRFPYHPDPLATGSIVVSENRCWCCEQARGYIYTGPVYAIQQLQDCFCPWCIADGSAAAKFDAEYVDGGTLLEAGLLPEIVAMVRFCTPSYRGRQEEQWLSHCDDACEYHGDASSQDIAEASAVTRERWQTDYEMTRADWEWATSDYRPGGDHGFYKFICRHCRTISLAWDLS